MTLLGKRLFVAVLGVLFLVSLVAVHWMESVRKQEWAGLAAQPVVHSHDSKACIDCHRLETPGIVEHWEGSSHAMNGVGCAECHKAETQDIDAFKHHGITIATIVTPLDCSRCHEAEYEEFVHSHHAKGGNILASLDNFLAETVEGAREPFNPHSPTPGMAIDQANGMASVNVGCKQCHGSKVALEGADGQMITVDDLEPGPDGKPTNQETIRLVKRDENNKPILHASSWPNTGLGRINLDG